MTPHVMVVAYDFPPHGAIGTMRTLRVVRALRERGWAVSVVTGDPETYLPGTPVEPALERQVPSGVQVVRVRAFRGMDRLTRLAPRPRASASGKGETSSRRQQPRGTRSGKAGILRRAHDRVDAWLSIPDNESGWMAPAVRAGMGHARAVGRPDVLYSSSPPWSGQVVALALARWLGCPWVADFRDPWARAPWRDWRLPVRQRAASWLERQVVSRADAVLFVTQANRDEFAATYGAKAAARFHLVPNGCDPAELDAAAPLPPRPEFVLLHAGTLYGARNPMPVLEAIAQGVRRGTLDPARFRLRLLGTVSLAQDLAVESRRLGIADVVEFLPRVGREESLRELKSASALLLVQVGTTVSVPGKAYEYLAAGRPVLALSEEGETADLVRASGAGVSVTPAAPLDAIEAALHQVMALADNGFVPVPSGFYDGRVHAATTERLLQQLVQRPPDAAYKGEVYEPRSGAPGELKR